MKITGIVKVVTFRNSENGWSVLKLTPVDGGDEFSAVGTMAEDGNVLGLTFDVSGEWSNHPTYGRQFQFQSARCIRPTTLDGLKRYLSCMVHSLGDKTAAAVVDALGEQTVSVLNAGDPRTLLVIPGIGPERAQAVMEQWRVGEATRGTHVNLMSLGIGSSLCVRMVLYYQERNLDAWDVVNANPYSLTEMWGVGFKTADEIARKLQFALDDPRRLKAAIIYALQQARDGEGHCYLPQFEVVKRVGKITSLPETRVGEFLEQDEQERPLPEGDRKLNWDDAFVLDYDDTDEFEGPRYYHHALYRDERAVAHDLLELAKPSTQTHMWLSPQALQGRFEREVGYRLTDEQLEAVGALTMGAGVGVLTGSPGVGKTASLRAILIQAEAAGLDVRLAAPTGRAAKRMEDLTNHEATTIHRLLQWTEFGFVHNAENRIRADLVVVDESSMVDIRLMSSLVQALTPGRTQLLLVGDFAQLPSVGAGNVLRDVIASGAVQVCHLTKIMRQAENSGIIVDAHRINRGESPTLDWVDCTFVEAEEPERVQDIVRSLCVNADMETQVLTPQRTGDLGTRELNRMLQAAVNPPRAGCGELKVGTKDRERIFRVGDRVMQIRNDYQRERMNGAIGQISHVNVKSKELTIDFGDGSSTYGISDLVDVEHAFICTTHKAQGNEYPQVVFIAHKSMSYMMNRTLLYTALTRAQQRAVIVGQKAAVDYAARNNKIVQRYTRLNELLQQ